MNKTNLLLSTAVGLAFVIAGPAAMAAGKKHPNGQKNHAFAKVAGAKRMSGQSRSKNGLKEKFLIETWGTTTASLPGGTQVVPQDASFNFNCKKACTVVTYNTAEFLTYYSYNQVGICPMVDGYFTNGSCFFSGVVHPDDEYTVRTNQTNISLGSGTHTAQTYVYTVAPAFMGHFQNDYHVYQ